MTINPAESPAAAVVWAVATSVVQTGCSSERHCPGYLLAYKLDPGSQPTPGAVTQIWPASLPATPDFEPGPFAIPTVTNGKVYVPCYGLSNGQGGYMFSGIEVYGFCSGRGCQEFRRGSAGMNMKRSFWFGLPLKHHCKDDITRLVA